MAKDKTFKDGYAQAIKDVMDTMWFDKYTAQKPDAFYVLSRLELRVRTLLEDKT